MNEAPIDTNVNIPNVNIQTDNNQNIIASTESWVDETWNTFSETKSSHWLVKNLIAENSINWIYGAPGSFKSFLIMDMALNIACGNEWMGRPVKQKPVLWIAAEGGVDVHLRRAAWESFNGHPKAPMKIFNAQPLIDEPLERRGDNVWTNSGLHNIMYELNLMTSPLEQKALVTEARKIIDGGKTIKDGEKLNSVLERFGYVSPIFKKAKSFFSDRCFERIIWTQNRCGKEESDLNYRLDDFIGTAVETYYKASRGATRPIWPDVKKLLAEGYPWSQVGLIVIDTYSQTSASDDKSSVNEYTRNLTKIIENCAPRAAIIVIDHTTKSGDSFMGAQAKLGNVDMMAKIERKGDVGIMSMKSGKGKIKNAAEFSDICLTLSQHEIKKPDGAYLKNSDGDVVSSLICKNGELALKMAQTVGSKVNSAASIILGLIKTRPDGISDNDLKKLYAASSINKKKKNSTVMQSYRRSKKSLLEDGLIRVDGELILPANK